MAESVDALVSNTSGATRAGSTPALGTKVPRVRLQNALAQRKARCCKTTTYSTFSFYKTKVFLSKFSPHFPHRCKFDAIEWEILVLIILVFMNSYRLTDTCFMIM